VAKQPAGVGTGSSGVCVEALGGIEIEEGSFRGALDSGRQAEDFAEDRRRSGGLSHSEEGDEQEEDQREGYVEDEASEARSVPICS
jgi:hypothetical protein